VETRRRAADRLTRGLSGLQGLRTPVVKPHCTHVYYIYPLVVDPAAVGVAKTTIAKALAAEGVEGVGAAYQNLHLLPMYQRKIAYGNRGFPWTSDICKRDVSYAKGICPVAEELQDSTYLGFAMCMHALDDDDVDLVVAAFRKVWSNLSALAEYEKNHAA
jgi:dTDP-4-amino-4,6-dideoxygalactose transaminase